MADETFNPKDYTKFVYDSFLLDGDTLLLSYRLVGASKEMAFAETFTLPAATVEQNGDAKEAAQRLARLVFLAAGLSYFKAAAPLNVEIIPSITQQELEFLKQLYKNGLTEFAYVNKMREALEPEFQATIVATKALHLALQNQPLVPIGGGKDSTVTIEALRAVGFSPLLFSQNTFPPMAKTAEVAKLPYVITTRKLDEKILTLPAQGAFGGHIPITVLVSFVALLVAVRSGRGVVVMSNERSASVGNVVWEGIEVNHQWSKSMQAEELLRQLVKAIVADDLEYFSLLRPFSELKIVEYFAERLPQYHAAFTSCNRAFRLVENRRIENWCTNCDKCRFVFLALAPFMSRQKLETIFGKNILADPSQLDGFRELLGIQGHKPLECVGEVEECRAALMMITENPEWANVATISELLKDLPPAAMPTPDQVKRLMTAQAEHFIPQSYLGAMHEIQ